MCKSPGEQRTIPAIIRREPCWETQVEERKTGVEKANQEVTAIILTAGNNVSQGGINGQRRGESHIRDLKKKAINAIGPTGDRICDGRTAKL